MNLVKAQEYAASLPLAELKKYADGLNPSMIPPWLATGEMQAKMKRAEMASNLQGAAQGPQPSIKEQVEQKAGLMALMQAQQQGTPEGIPQPNPQPQAGLDQLPSNIQMAGGGIVAFAGPTGSKVEGKEEKEDDESSQFVRDIAKLPQTFDELKQRAREEDAIKAAQDRRMAERKKEMLEARSKTSLFNYLFGSPTREKEGLSKLAELSNAPLASTAEKPSAPLDAESQKLLNLAATRSDTGVNANPALKPSAAPASNIAQLAAAQNKPPRPAAPTPVAPTAAAPAPTAPAQDSMEALFRKALENKPSERTVQDLIAEQNAIRAGTGLGEEAGKAKLERIAALNKQYESTQMTPMQELIAMLGQSGQYKGLSGLAPAYTSMAEKKRAADLTQAQKINELMGAVEDTQRAEKTGVAGKVGEGRAKDRELSSQFDRERMQQLASTRGQDVQSAASKYNADMHYKSAMAQLSNANARQDMQEKRLLLDAFKTELATIDRELGPLLKAPFGPAKAQIAELQARKAGLTKALDEASGISKITGAPSAASPSGNRPPLSSFQR